MSAMMAMGSPRHNRQQQLIQGVANRRRNREVESNQGRLRSRGEMRNRWKAPGSDREDASGDA